MLIDPLPATTHLPRQFTKCATKEYKIQVENFFVQTQKRFICMDRSYGQISIVGAKGTLSFSN